MGMGQTIQLLLEDFKNVKDFGLQIKHNGKSLKILKLEGLIKDGNILLKLLFNNNKKLILAEKNMRIAF